MANGIFVRGVEYRISARDAESGHMVYYPSAVFVQPESYSGKNLYAFADGSSRELAVMRLPVSGISINDVMVVSKHNLESSNILTYHEPHSPHVQSFMLRVAELLDLKIAKGPLEGPYINLEAAILEHMKFIEELKHVV